MRRLSAVTLIGCMGLVLALTMPAGPTHLPSHDCPPDSERVATACLDKYEASVWLIPAPYTMNENIAITKIRDGTVSKAHLTAAGATQLGLIPGDLVDNGCPVNGHRCLHVYAVSIRGVEPATHINWFQAVAAARNSWKRLPTNVEWTAGVMGTPDPGEARGAEAGGQDCNTFGGGRQLTGTRANCKSDAELFDMVGNVEEWVADWVPRAPACVAWPPFPQFFGDDRQCLTGVRIADPVPDGSVVALARGGGPSNGEEAGVFAVSSIQPYVSTLSDLGFRAAR